MLVKIYVDGHWLFGKEIDGYFVLPSGRKFPIDDEGRVLYNGQKYIVYDADYIP